MKKCILLFMMSCLLDISGTTGIQAQSLARPHVGSVNRYAVKTVEESKQTETGNALSPASSGNYYLRWDVNRDGEVTIADVNDVLDYILNGTDSPIGNSYYLRWDVNRDGEVTIADVNGVLDCILNGTESSLPAISSAYYYIGTSNRFAMFDPTYRLDNGGVDVYENPVFSVVIPVTTEANYFKIYSQETMDVAPEYFWNSNFIGYYENGTNGMSGTFVEGTNDIESYWFEIPAQGTSTNYRLSFDMLNRTFEFEDVADEGDRANQLFNKCYAYVRCNEDSGIWNGYEFYYFRCVWCANELTSDAAICNWGDPGIPELCCNTYGPSHNVLRNLYRGLYASIECCNDYLSKYGGYNAGMSAEVRFIRAMDYFYLLDCWGNVPLVTSVNAYYPTQASRAQVFHWLEQELLDLREGLSAPKALKEGDEGYGRVDRDAADLLLARLYLNAQVYCGEARWADAARFAKMVMDGPHKLNTQGVWRGDWYYTPYQILFMGDNGQTSAATEAVFSIPQDGINAQSWHNTMFLIASTFDADMHEDPFYSSATNGINGIFGNETWAGNRARPELVRLFFPNDNAPVGPGYEVAKSAGDDRALFNTSGGRTLENTDPFDFRSGYAVAKFNNFKTDGSSSGSNFPDADLFMMRSAEAYLTYAEALTRQAGGSAPAEAVAALNAIRGRANAGIRSNYTLSQILDEWGREFYFEGRRRMDLIRFNRYGGETDYLWSWKGGYYSGLNFEDYRNLFAIPDFVLAENPNFVQNPGYDAESAQQTTFILNQPTDALIDLSHNTPIHFEWSRPEHADWGTSYQLQVSVANEWTVSTEEASADATGTTVANYAVLPLYGGEVSTTELNRVLLQLCQWTENQVPDRQTVYVRCVANIANTAYSNVVTLQVKPYYSALIDLWYLVGYCIGDGSWENSVDAVGTGLIPLYPSPEDYSVLTYVGYFPAWQGFKLIHEPGSWDEQWGMRDGTFVKNDYDCNDIEVTADGYYKLTYHTEDETLSLEPYYGYVDVYGVITMPGSYQFWDVTQNAMRAMSSVVENHDWCLKGVTYPDTELKFANGSWDKNWGAADFPVGVGQWSGLDIPVPAGTYNVYFNDILGTYYFELQ